MFPYKGILEQVIYNLLSNAASHTEANCTIDISATCYADLLQLIIEDDGKGFTAQEAKDVFNKFSRTKNLNASGSGLGLSIVKGFTEALGGSVELQKINPTGSRFIIAIPVKTTSLKLSEG